KSFVPTTCRRSHSGCQVPTRRRSASTSEMFCFGNIPSLRDSSSWLKVPCGSNPRLLKPFGLRSPCWLLHAHLSCTSEAWHDCFRGYPHGGSLDEPPCLGSRKNRRCSSARDTVTPG